ncbi:hypothetical protein ACQZV8_00700, partial [Magnetococcales bacterium HHB-1]
MDILQLGWRQRWRQAFFQYGWLIPGAIPLLFLLGRAFGSVGFVIYLIWAVVSLWGEEEHTPKELQWLYLAMIFAFGLSVWPAIYPEK